MYLVTLTGTLQAYWNYYSKKKKNHRELTLCTSNMKFIISKYISYNPLKGRPNSQHFNFFTKYIHLKDSSLYTVSSLISLINIFVLLHSLPQNIYRTYKGLIIKILFVSTATSTVYLQAKMIKTSWVILDFFFFTVWHYRLVL